MAIEKVYQYKHLYLAVLAACNQLPESEDASTIYAIADLDVTTIAPLNPDRYPALEVFRCVHAAETDILKTKLAQAQQGRVAGKIEDGGFIEYQDITEQGAYINSHVGRVLNVEVERDTDKWVKGTLETIEQVTRMSDPGYPLSLETAKGLYAMDSGEKQIWFVGLKARVYYLTFKLVALPESMEDLLHVLELNITADDEDASAIIELAVSMVLPTGGAMEGTANTRMQRAMARLGMNAAGKQLPDAQVKINSKMGIE